MCVKVEDKLKHYWANSLVASYIFSEDITSKLEKNDITQKSWFLRFFSKFVEDNKEFEILSQNANNNCKILINRLRFLESTSIEDKEKYNEMLITLNSSGSENSDLYVKELFINSSLDQNKAKRNFSGALVYDSALEMLFDTCCDVVKLLLEEDEQLESKRIYQLSNNEFYFYCLIDLIKLIPEILEENRYFSLLYAVLEVNKKRMLKMDLDIEIGMENIKIKKHLKKLKKNY